MPQVAQRSARNSRRRREFLGLLLRLHRSTLAYRFTAMDATAISSALLPAVALVWLLLVHTGLLSLALVSRPLAWCPAPPAFPKGRVHASPPAIQGVNMH